MSDAAADHPLRGADAVYAVVAHALSLPLVTLDAELRRRAAGFVRVVSPWGDMIIGTRPDTGVQSKEMAVPAGFFSASRQSSRPPGRLTRRPLSSTD